MKITEKTQVVGHEIELSGKSLTGRTISITLSGGFDVQIGDFYVYRDADINVQRRKAGLDEVILSYASKQDLTELCDLAISRFQALKDAVK